jgi:hypothetical protein
MKYLSEREYTYMGVCVIVTNFYLKTKPSQLFGLLNFSLLLRVVV